MGLFSVFSRKSRHERLLDALAGEGEPKWIALLEEIRRQGATDEEISAWQQKSSAEREVVVRIDEVGYATAVQSQIDAGSPEDAALRWAKINWPRYSEYAPGRSYDADDPLSYEMREAGRDIERWLLEEGIQPSIPREATSMNAFIRQRVELDRAGESKEKTIARYLEGAGKGGRIIYRKDR